MTNTIVTVLVALGAAGGIGGIAAIINAILGFKKLQCQTIEWKKAQLNLKLNNLREAFLMERNDKISRLAAWREYKALGGDNFDNFEKVI